MNSSTIDFITNLLSDTLHLDFHYFIAPYPDLVSFDKHLRKSLTDSDLLYEKIQAFISGMEKNTFYYVSDNYLINYVFFFPFQDRKDVMTIGPYFNTPINDRYWNRITEINHLNSHEVNNIKGFLYSIPQIDNNLQLTSIVSNIVSYINRKEYPPYSIEYHNFHLSDNRDIYAPKDNFEAYYNAVDSRYNSEKQLLHYIRKGNWENALIEAEAFLKLLSEPRLKNTLRDHKYQLTSANTLFRKAIEENKIHPVYLHEISSKFVNEIESTASHTVLNKLYEKMIVEYCLLVQKKSRNNYSLTVRKILDYVEFNFSTAITLKIISDKLSLSSSYISSQFKKEVGITVIRYINQLRIDEAIKLLKHSSMSIQDIASSVGIMDYNYFTKLFKSEIGISPSLYRKTTVK